MGIFGLFGGNNVPTDHIDEIVGLARADQDRMRLEREAQKKMNGLGEGSAYLEEHEHHVLTKRDLAEARALNKKLLPENANLQEMATRLFVDRRSLINTIEYLATKWINPSELEAFLNDAQNFRELEGDRLSVDDELAKKVSGPALNFNAKAWTPHKHPNGKIGLAVLASKDQ